MTAPAQPGPIEPHSRHYAGEARLAALLLGGISLLIALYPAYWEVQAAITRAFGLGALAFLILSVFPRPALTRRALGLLAALPMLAVLLSLAYLNIWATAASGLHHWRGYPYHWLAGVAPPGALAPGAYPAAADANTFAWSLFWPGLLVDYLFWLNLAVTGLLVVWAARRFSVGRLAAWAGRWFTRRREPPADLTH